LFYFFNTATLNRIYPLKVFFYKELILKLNMRGTLFYLLHHWWVI